MPVLLTFVDGVRVVRPKSGAPRIKGPGDDIVIERRAAGILDVLRGFARGYSTYEALTAQTLRRGGIPGLRALHEHLEQLFARGWIAHRVSHRGARIISLLPVTGDYPLAVRAAGTRGAVLSRFALLRRDGPTVILESPTAHARAVVHDPRALTIFWEAADAPTRRVPSALPRAVRRSITDLLWSGGFLTDRDPATGTMADEAPPLVNWEFHDLLFHSRSRLGRHASPYGATFRLQGRVEPPPVSKQPSGGQQIPLTPPDIGRLTETDWTLTRTLEQRRSHRHHGVPAITRDQLGTFLYRAAGTRAIAERGPEAASTRVYPSGGATYCLELYVAARECQGLDAGMYRYCPIRNELQHVSGMTGDVRALLADASKAAACTSPQVLITIAARFLRVSWKYSSLSYALVLKEVGALLQTMYLVATAMRLGACAIGGGNSDLFAKATGTDYYDEGSVGELLLGTCRPS